MQFMTLLTVVSVGIIDVRKVLGGMMLGIKEVKKLQRMYGKGMKISEIAREMGIDRKTVRKHLYDQESPKRTGHTSKLDPYKKDLDRMLKENLKGIRKWTAVSMHKALSEEHPELAKSYLLIQRYAKEWKSKHKSPS